MFNKRASSSMNGKALINVIMDWFNHEFQEKGESFKLYLLRTMDYRQKSKPGKQDFMGIYFSKKKC